MWRVERISLSLRGILYLGTVLVRIFRSMQIHFRWFGGMGWGGNERQKSRECGHPYKLHNATLRILTCSYTLGMVTTQQVSYCLANSTVQSGAHSWTMQSEMKGRERIGLTRDQLHIQHRDLNSPGITREFKLPKQSMIVQRHPLSLHPFLHPPCLGLLECFLLKSIPFIHKKWKTLVNSQIPSPPNKD